MKAVIMVNLGFFIASVGRKVSENAISAVGTCFKVGPGLYATAAHVTGPSDEGLSISQCTGDPMFRYQDTTHNRAYPVPASLVHYDPINDVSIMEAKRGDPQHQYVLGDTDNVSVGEDLVTLGYPHAVHGRIVLTRQPVTVGAKMLLGNANAPTRALVLNAVTRPGQSGAPVFNLQGNAVCAMVTGGYAPEAEYSVSIDGINPQSLHQTTHAISAEYIKDLLR